MIVRRSSGIDAIGQRIYLACAIVFQIAFLSNPAQPLITNLHQLIARGNDSYLTNRVEAPVTGVVTYVTPQSNRFYLQEGSNAVYVDITTEVGPDLAGQKVEVWGEVKPGWLVPRIVAQNF